MTKCGFCNNDKPFSGMAAKLPEGGRAHICAECAKTGQFEVTWGLERMIKVELKGKVSNARNQI